MASTIVDMKSENIDIHCEDGLTLSGVAWLPESNAKGAIVIAPALGVPQKIYGKLAAYFARAGYVAMTFDYRGYGRAIPDTPPRLHHWGSLDLEAAITTAAGRFCSDRLFLIGHSIGGQVTGLAPSSNKLTGVVLVAASFPYWKRWPMPSRLSIGFLFNIFVPFVCAWRQTFPTKLLGLGSIDLPGSIMSDWARWLRRDNYLLDKKFGFDANGYEVLTQPILAWGFDDDNFEVRLQEIVDSTSVGNNCDNDD